MHSLSIDQLLPEYVVTAKNFAADSENRMHGDETAPRYGYKGGLVPGVGTFGYMSRPVAAALGRDWLERGTLTGKFIKPIYDNDTIRVEARVVSTDPLRVLLSVLNEEGTLCAVGEASILREESAINVAEFPLQPKPGPGSKFPPTADALKEGTQIGSLCFPLDYVDVERGIVSDLDDALELYRGPTALCHPAFVVQKANVVVTESVDLGPWIHTESNVEYHAQPTQGELVCLRAKVRNSYVRRGHETAIFEMVFTGENERLLAHMTHSAIVKPKPVD